MLVTSLIGVLLLSACGPSDDALLATSTTVPPDVYASQTAGVPSATPTRTH